MPTPYECVADRMIGNAFYNGWPDRVVPTKPPTAIEIKSGKDGLSPAQRRMRKILCDAGWRYFVLRVDASQMVRIVEHVNGADIGVGYADFMRALGRPMAAGKADRSVRRVPPKGMVSCECGWVGLVENLYTIQTTTGERRYCRLCGLSVEPEAIA